MVHEVKNPIIASKLAQLRNKNTPSKDFRELVEEIAIFLTYEAAKKSRRKENFLPKYHFRAARNKKNRRKSFRR